MTRLEDTEGLDWCRTADGSSRRQEEVERGCKRGQKKRFGGGALKDEKGTKGNERWGLDMGNGTRKETRRRIRNCGRGVKKEVEGGRGQEEELRRRFRWRGREDGLGYEEMTVAERKCSKVMADGAEEKCILR